MSSRFKLELTLVHLILTPSPLSMSCLSSNQLQTLFYPCNLINNRNCTKQSLKLNYRAINILLHTSNQIGAQPMVPIVHRHHIHFRKHNGQSQINYLNDFINLFGH